jgi:NAD(P)-dependent dehydrogenase (short-subunit alcohol dehydrogenase family)
MALAGAKLFVDEGAHVFIAGRRQDALDEAVELIGRNVTGVQADCANLVDLDRLFDTVRREKGAIDVLWTSAGTAEERKLGEITEQHFDATFGLNARGTLGPEGTATVQRRRLDLHDRVDRFGQGLSLLECLRREQGCTACVRPRVVVRVDGPQDPGQRADPGQVVAPGQEQRFDDETKAAMKAREVLIPRRKNGSPAEIATGALFLASDDSSFVNGMELIVDGGTTAV